MVAGGSFDVTEQFDGIVSVRIDGTPRCAAALISHALAISAASCFLRSHLTEHVQTSCARGECDEALVPSESIRLIGGADPRGGPVIARVKRLAVRFTSASSLPLACTSRWLCGEGWDVALLELDPSCDHGPMPCLRPLKLPSTTPSLGHTVTVVGFGHSPIRVRSEWSLALGVDGAGVRRAGLARVTQVVSSQVLRIGSVDSGLNDTGLGPLCSGDLGAAIVTKRSSGWELDAVGLVEPQFDSGCTAAEGRAWMVRVSRCWLEAALSRWARPPLSEAHAAECGALDFLPPELVGTNTGAAVVDGANFVDGGAAFEAACAAVDCSSSGKCKDGTCVCVAGHTGPRCTLLNAIEPLTLPQIHTFAVSPTGTDDAGCGPLLRPCRTIRQALFQQSWYEMLRERAGVPAVPQAGITLLEGTFSGDGNTALHLHGLLTDLRSVPQLETNRRPAPS
jgi:hypothetical protein